MADTGIAEGLQARAENLASMSFLEHLEELRHRIIRSALGILVGFGLCWWKWEKIYGYMQRPIMQALRKNGLEQKLVYLNPVEPFNMSLKVALLAGLFLAAPWVLWQVWQFISPGLYRNEKKYVLPFMFSTVALFAAGGYFGYRLVYPQALNFLVHFGSNASLQPMITINEYTDLFLTIVAGLGIVFELPILVFFLALMGIMSPGWMWRTFRYAILVIFVIAMVITPTPDVMSLCVVATPMVALYAFSILIAYLVHPKRRKARAGAA